MKIKNEEITEFVDCLIDIFDDFLTEKGATIENQERQDAIDNGEAPESVCLIYGSDYGELHDLIMDMVLNWELAESEIKEENTHEKIQESE